MTQTYATPPTLTTPPTDTAKVIQPKAKRSYIPARPLPSTRLRIPANSAALFQRPEALDLAPVAPVVPRSGIQQYYQRLTALKAGRLYTRLPANSYQEVWSQAQGQPTYDQWRKLLALEARAAGRGQGTRSMAVLVGDSLSQWYPVQQLPGNHIWLNQGISGDTTGGILNRLSAFAKAKPQTIYVMAGVNDLKKGLSDREILRNLNGIVQRLQAQNPNAQIVVQSILPTRTKLVDNRRVAQLNNWIATIAQRNNVAYLDLHQQFTDSDGMIKGELTTDGIHLSPQGYELWQTALQRAEMRLAAKPQTVAQSQALRSESM
jgi:lysophospholipase L1-like esterase